MRGKSEVYFVQGNNFLKECQLFSNIPLHFRSYPCISQYLNSYTFFSYQRKVGSLQYFVQGNIFWKNASSKNFSRAISFLSDKIKHQVQKGPGARRWKEILSKWLAVKNQRSTKFNESLERALIDLVHDFKSLICNLISIWI